MDISPREPDCAETQNSSRTTRRVGEAAAAFCLVSDMATQRFVADYLASAFVCGRWECDDLVDRGADALGRRWRWLRPLAQRALHTLGHDRRPSRFQVLRFLRQDEGLRRACHKHDVRVGGLQRKPPEMAPTAGHPVNWDVPPLVTVGELADWLDLKLTELDWFADRRGLERKVPRGPLRHYRYYWLSKRIGGSARLIESPKQRLKAIQRCILHEILDRIPPHEAAHGFCRGRSIRSFVAPHAGQSIVLRADLRDFFPCIPRRRVAGVFRTAGYPEEVSQCLAALGTNEVPDDVWRSFPQYGNVADRWRHQRLYGQPHLPQGTATSPAIANLCSYRLDCRLAGLARSFRGRYTRYADDLLFSGGRVLARSIGKFHRVVYAIAMDEGFEINPRKTRIMRQGVRQCAAGLTVNRHPNIPRDEFDRLKAILYNCARRGPGNENHARLPEFRLHLDGHVSFVESVNPARGQKLRSLFERIQWPAT